MRCYLCGRLATDRHHLINGLAYRSKADDYGLVVWLCRECHNEVHYGKNSRALMDRFRKEAQMRFEREHPDLDFTKIFRINFLEEGEAEQVDSIDLNDPLPWEDDKLFEPITDPLPWHKEKMERKKKKR